jgi:hypothetical protein
MDRLSKQDLNTLLQTRGVCVSIYFPTEGSHDPIRLKHLVESARRQMLNLGLTDTQVKDVLDPARRLIQHNPKRPIADDGYAIFASGDFFRSFRLPIRFREQSVVAARFHIKPLLPLLSGDGQFWILAISDNRVRLFRASRYKIAELDNNILPASLHEAMQFEDFQPQLQLHTAGSSGQRTPIYHGRSAAIEDRKQTRLRYFRQIDVGVQSLVHHNQVPLVLAGVAELFPIYREANTHPVLLERGVTGNPDHKSADELRAAAWDVVEPYFGQQKAAALRTYHGLLGTSRTSSNLREILVTSSLGRVKILFIKTEVELWGRFDPSSQEVSLHLSAETGDEDLLNLAATQAVIQGATVYALSSTEMPHGCDVAAVFRY